MLITGLARALRRRISRKLCVIEVSSCVHYCAFHYGRSSFNPYENYVQGLVRGENLQRIRDRFEDFLRYYRPRSMGEALGVPLGKVQPLWSFPWENRTVRHDGPAHGWFVEPADVPDILTHFSEKGVLRSRIVEEYGWLENTLSSIRKVGYDPVGNSGHIEARRFRSVGGDVMHLVTDGNHRLSALSALGWTQVPVLISEAETIHESKASNWRQVCAGHYSAADAVKVFSAYFAGNRRPRTTDTPARILD